MGRMCALVIATLLFVGPGLVAGPGQAIAQIASVEDLAKKHANPVSDIISVPFQFNLDCCLGQTEGHMYTLKFQPVYPFNLSAKWKLITRTILPVVYREPKTVGGDDAFGLDDTLQHFFFSRRHKYTGHTVGFGPVINWPTGTNSQIDSGKWSAGPTFVLFHQHGPWTMGTLTHHIWSFANAGHTDASRVSMTQLEPTLAYTWKNATSLTLSSEAKYDWTKGQWNIPVNLLLSHIYHFGDQPVSLGFGGRVYVATPPGGPTWGLRAVVTFLFDPSAKR